MEIIYIDGLWDNITIYFLVYYQNVHILTSKKKLKLECDQSGNATKSKFQR